MTTTRVCDRRGAPLCQTPMITLTVSRILFETGICVKQMHFVLSVKLRIDKVLMIQSTSLIRN